MRLKIGKHLASKQVSRQKKKVRIRRNISGTATLPRLSVYKSNRNLSAQLIDDVTGTTLASASSQNVDTSGKKGLEVAALVGAKVAEAAKAKNINQAVFDRNGFIYHGKVKAIADAAREAGLQF